MRYELFDFQKKAVNSLLLTMNSMQRSYTMDGALSAVSLTAPTGSGKTVICAAVAEGLFYGNEVFPGDDSAVILWLSDSPSLNEQTLKRFDDASDLLNNTNSMSVITPDFAKNHKRLMPGNIYFLNRQLLGKDKKLSNEAEGGRTFYDVLNDTIDSDAHLYLFIDEAHRGIGSGDDKGTSESANKTIYSIIIDGQAEINKPIPCVVGISATPERFNSAMCGRKNRDRKAGIDVPVSDVRESGLIKETIELRTPSTSSDTKHQDLTEACKKLANVSKCWNDYCTNNEVAPVVIPLMVVQVEDKVSIETLSSLCAQIHSILPWLDISDCFANVFGEHNNLVTGICSIPYVKPDEVAEKTNIRVLFAKDAVSTGWDCPRAEVIYSRRRRTDPTYIAQLIGRMIRTPLARRVESVEELNTVSCYLPEFDAETVDLVVSRLKEDNLAIDPNKILKNPVDVSFFGKVKQTLEKQMSNESLASEVRDAGLSSNSFDKIDTITKNDTSSSTSSADFSFENFDYSINLGLDVNKSTQELKDILARIPDVDAEDLKRCFEEIVTRQVRHDKTDHFLDLWECADIIQNDIDQEADIGFSLKDDFFNNIEGEILKHPAEFRRSLNDICNTKILVKRVDPLTGKVFEERHDFVENDSVRLTSYYKHAVTVFAGASDLVKYYINKRVRDNSDSEIQAIRRISAVASCLEIVQSLELWAETKTEELLSIYGPQRYAVSEENRSKWDKIEGNTKPYIERNLNIQASVTRQNQDYEKYPKHIISDENGWAYLKLNDIEKVVVNTELKKSITVGFYRNQSRNLNASLSIPYELNGEWENMYPDFIFFVKYQKGLARVIVDPHGDWLGDSVPKLKGYIEYIKSHPDMFVQVLVVADEKCGEYRYLDLMQKNVQKAIEDFSGSSAKELFTGKFSKKYITSC